MTKIDLLTAFCTGFSIMCAICGAIAFIILRKPKPLTKVEEKKDEEPPLTWTTAGDDRGNSWDIGWR